MPAVSLVCGLLIGAAEIIMTGKIADKILIPDEKKLKAALLLVIKLALYAGAICLVLFVKKCSPVFAGVGYGVGMVVGCAAYLIGKKTSADRDKKTMKQKRSDTDEND